MCSIRIGAGKKVVPPGTVIKKFVDEAILTHKIYMLLLVERGGVTIQRAACCGKPIAGVIGKIIVFPRTVIVQFTDVPERIDVIDVLLLIEICRVAS